MKGGANAVDNAHKKAIRPIKPYVVPEGATTEYRAFPVVIKEGASAKLSFRVPGMLEDFDVTTGRRFEQGEVVAQLERRDYQLIVERCKQALVEARAGLRAMETGARPEDLASAEAGYEAAQSQRETAEKQYRRIESLYNDGSASAMQYDLAKSTYDSAVAAERAAEKTLEKAQKGSRIEEIEMMKAKIAGLEIDLQLAENKLKDTTLVAPFSGVVTEKFYDNHETVVPSVAIVTLVDDQRYEGELSVTEEVALRLSDITKIECTFDALPGRVFSATIKEASTSIQKNTRSYLMTISIDASERDGALIGMVGVATISLADPNAFMLVPVAALTSGPPSGGSTPSSETNVWVVDMDTLAIARRSVTVGATVGDKVRILSGLSGGETIVGAGARFLSDGQKIRLPEEEE
jgi:RND family efflux transporter MFP subunit